MSLNYCASHHPASVDLPNPNARLHALRLNLQIIDRAFRLRSSAQWCEVELVASYAGDWADSQRGRARTIIQLMRLNRQTEHLKNLMMSGGQIGSIPLTVHGAPVRVGGAQTPVNHWAFEFLKAAAKSGLIDAEEVVNANLAGGLTMVGPQ